MLLYARRFQSMIYFPVPSPHIRHQLWQNAFGNEFILDETINLNEIARSYEISGGAISNVLRYCGLQALQRHSNVVLKEDLLTGIRRELMKEGKTVK